jgi:hypothetical protein
MNIFNRSSITLIDEYMNISISLVFLLIYSNVFIEKKLNDKKIKWRKIFQHLSF